MFFCSHDSFYLSTGKLDIYSLLVIGPTYEKTYKNLLQNENMIQEFKEFIMRGNVLDLAVAVIIAGAFGTVITSFTNDIILPPIGLMLGGVDFSSLAILLQPEVVNAAGEITQEAVKISYGAFIQTIINFVIIAFVIFMVVKGYNASQKNAEEAPTAPPAPSNEEVLLTQIRDLLSKKS